MSAVVFTPIESRPPPTATKGVLAWIQRNFFDGWLNSLATIVTVLVLLWLVPPLFGWSVLHAVFAPDNAACRAAQEHGACWGVVAEKGRLILFGRYPFEEQWRPLAACAILIALLVASCLRPFWKPWLAPLWLIVLAVCYVLMRGGVLGLTPVETSRWGGFPLTLALSVVSLAVAFPLAILVALGRTSKLPAIRAVCVLYVELIRGVPLITVLFMASFMFPLFMPHGMTIDVLLRVLVGVTLFAAAYLAEVVRGGLQALPKGPGRGGAGAGAHLLANHPQDRAAAGAAAGGADDRQHLHRHVQGQLAGHHRESVRPHRRFAARVGRRRLAQVLPRGAVVRGGDLLRLLFRVVALQPLGRGLSEHRHAKAVKVNP